MRLAGIIYPCCAAAMCFTTVPSSGGTATMSPYERRLAWVLSTNTPSQKKAGLEWRLGLKNDTSLYITNTKNPWAEEDIQGILATKDLRDVMQKLGFRKIVFRYVERRKAYWLMPDGSFRKTFNFD